MLRANKNYCTVPRFKIDVLSSAGETGGGDWVYVAPYTLHVNFKVLF